MTNNKGMTLIEEIVALAVIAIASLIMLVGFSTAANVFGDSTKYKNITNKQYSALLGNEHSDKDISISNNPATVIITVNDKAINVDGQQYQATSKKDAKTVLSTIKFEDTVLSNTEKTLNNCKDYLDSVRSFTTIEQFNDWIKNQGVDAPGYSGGEIKNECYRYCYYYRYGETHLTLEQNIIDECNRIFDNTHSGAIDQDEINARIGNKTLYIKPYFCGGLWQYGANIENCYFLIVSETANINDKSQYQTKLIYARGNWYYKVFPAGQERNSYVDVNGFSAGNATVDSLFNGTINNINLSDQSQWVKIN